MLQGTRRADDTDTTEILDAIRRCAEENGGRAVGKARFERLTGISEAQWAGRYWVRWSDAVAEAGSSAGAMTTALPDDVVLDALADLIAELGHYPVAAEFRMKQHRDRCSRRAGRRTCAASARRGFGPGYRLASRCRGAHMANADSPTVARTRRTNFPGGVTSFAEGRVCEVDACEAILSRYNETQRCGIHTDGARHRQGR